MKDINWIEKFGYNQESEEWDTNITKMVDNPTAIKALYLETKHMEDAKETEKNWHLENASLAEKRGDHENAVKDKENYLQAYGEYLAYKDIRLKIVTMLVQQPLEEVDTGE